MLCYDEHELKSRETRPRAVESQPFITRQENICRKVMFYLIIFLMTKRETRRHQSRDQSVLNVLVRF